MKLNTENLIKLALAGLLLICLFQMPYGYYQLVRFVSVIGFAILAYYEYERQNMPMVIVFVGMIVLFQPLAKIPLGRELWIVVDVIVAAGLVITIITGEKKNT